MDDREILKMELMKLLDEIPLERLKALYIKALVASSAKVVNPDCGEGAEPREEIIAWIVEHNCESCHWAIFVRYGGLCVDS